MSDKITTSEIRAFIREYQRDGAPTCKCLGCVWARRFMRKLDVKIETVRQWNARMARK